LASGRLITADSAVEAMELGFFPLPVRLPAFAPVPAFAALAPDPAARLRGLPVPAARFFVVRLWVATSFLRVAGDASARRCLDRAGRGERTIVNSLSQDAREGCTVAPKRSPVGRLVLHILRGMFLAPKQVPAPNHALPHRHGRTRITG